MWATRSTKNAVNPIGRASGMAMTPSIAMGSTEADVTYSDHLMYMSRRCGLLRWFHHRETVT